MTPEQFTYWLQGYTEINGNAPTIEQWEIIKDHLHIVFYKVTPTYNPLPGSGGTTSVPPWNNPNTTIC